MIKKYITIAAIFSTTLLSCNYLDVVPDNVATIEFAFRTPYTTEQFLFTCYNSLPNYAEINDNPALAGGDEMFFLKSRFADRYRAYDLAEGNMNIVSPIYDYWRGRSGGTHLWKGINNCNTFLENIDNVYGIEDVVKERMAAEAKFLKAYYHFYLLRMYGPIPILDKNIPIHVSSETVRAIVREPIDKVFDFIIEMMDEAIEGLPNEVTFEVNELGRITRPIAMAIKAKILVTAASPLFNGNTEFSTYKNPRGEQLFNPNFDMQKWIKAKEAAELAIDANHAIGLTLNYVNQSTVNKESDTTLTELNYRTAITEKWNSEIIWASTNSLAASIQTISYPRIFGGAGLYFGGEASVPMHIAAKYYTQNGVPIDEDTTYDYDGRFSTRKATFNERMYVKQDYETAKFNLNRESRFYASLAFDGSRWYGQGILKDVGNHYVSARAKTGVASGHAYSYSITGYWPKKLVNHLNPATANQWTLQRYPWPTMRLADLYLLYAEAVNEVDGPDEEAFRYLNLIRMRAGLKGVQESWDNYSRTPAKYKTKEGLREIIHRERTIELAFEGSRFWDVRRWKTAMSEFNQNILGWDLSQEAPSAYYRQVIVTKKKFQQRDYFFPVQESEILKNRDIMQSPGWQF